MENDSEKEKNQTNQQAEQATSEEKSPRRFALSPNLTRYGTIGLIAILLVGLGLTVRKVFFTNTATNPEDLQATAQAMAAATLNPGAESEAISQSSSAGLAMPAYVVPDKNLSDGIERELDMDTIIPSRERVDVATYEVEQGDNIFAIADQYGLQPESILWGNEAVLKDDPRLISPGQLLNILPIDGVYYEYEEGKTLRQIAQEFEVEPEAIVEWPGNHLDPYETDLDTPLLAAAGSHLIIPGGVSEITDWGPPAISRANPAVAAYYGAGSCGQIYEGPIGNGTFVWPTTETFLSGYDYDPAIHPAIDIAGSIGNAIYATDSGVVVYAGWSEYGYGYMIVIDHGNGWQSAYAHLNSVGVGCGQSVYQGQVIGGLGTSGNSSGPHLHLELRSEIYGKVNPWNYLIP
ncbi:MAG: M23 family metallopeptidase [Anaerolineales bacterium]|nr:M23 family metallopeptidase [Anaerolineales bacterium]